MTRARDVASILTAASTLATDVETAAAISAHETAANGHIQVGTTAQRPENPHTGYTRLNTDGGVLEVWNGNVWQSAAGTPPPPTSVSATNQGSGRNYNNGQASISFTNPVSNGGSTITSYKVTSSPGGYTQTGSSSPLVITGLQSNTSYTFTATSTNTLGEGSSSVASASITASTIPNTPSLGTVTKVGPTEVSIPITVDNGGSSITSYTITSSPSISLTYSGTTSPISVSGSFAENTQYTFRATATNANGTSSLSSASNSVTPSITMALEYLVVAGGGGGADGYFGGGGGAGGFRTATGFSTVGGTTYNVTVGAGGSGGAYPSTPTNGSNSVFSTITSSGGGAGGQGNRVVGSAGGSGGGGSAGNLGGGTGSGGEGVSGQGNNGGTSNLQNDSTNVGGGGGGGGAGGVGGNPSGITGGAGGIGTASSITGSSVTYAGGGGGGQNRINNSGAVGGTGGAGGGGNGGARGDSITGAAATAGTVNTGGGGGGAGGGDSNKGMAGGSGVVILRANGSYTATSTTGSPTRVESGGYTYYKFNSSGSITI